MDELGLAVMITLVWLALGVIGVCILNSKYNELRKLGWYPPEEALGIMEGVLVWLWPAIFFELRECERRKKELLSTD